MMKLQFKLKMFFVSLKLIVVFGDGLQLFNVGEINNPSACEGYGDFTDQVAYLDENSTYSLTVTTGYGDQHVKVWIDFNDDSNFYK